MLKKRNGFKPAIAVGLGWAVAFLLFSPAVEAVYKMGDKKPVRIQKRKATSHSRTESPESKELEETPVLEGLSTRYGVPVSELEYYRNTHHGYEEIVPALVIAREAQIEVGRVLNDRMQGKSWKEIAEKLDVKLPPLNSEVSRLLKPIREVLPKAALTERPQVLKQ